MKKNAMLKIAAILMVAVLLTTCAISSTFAKYVTAPGAESNTARVAKWGVVVTATADDAFATEYNNGTEVSVKSQTTKNVVAPGTKVDNAVSLTVAGQPEVDAIVTVADGDFVTLGGSWDITGVTTYCPIKFTVKAGAASDSAVEFYVGGLDHSTDTADDEIADGAALIAAVNKYIEDNFATAEYDAEDGTAIDMVLNIGWEWIFEGETDADAYRTNARDTLLGNTVNADNGPTISFNAEVSVTQVD